MRILVAGGSGLLGHALVNACRADGHEVNVLTRHPSQAGDVGWSSTADGAWTSTLERSEAVVNLAGEGIADHRWTAARKAAILDSRVASTRALTDAMRACARPPRVFLSGSAVGFYGTDIAAPRTEASPAGSDFLATVCQAWEQAATAASGVARTVLLRTGVVLARHGGALPRMALPFRFFAGGRLGSGRQYMSWIHLDDWVDMVRWTLGDNAISGPVNVTAPAPVTNAEFTRALASAMRRPALFPVPAFALRAMLGTEMADSLLLGGQHVVPETALRHGFQFTFATVDSALRRIFDD